MGKFAKLRKLQSAAESAQKLEEDVIMKSDSSSSSEDEVDEKEDKMQPKKESIWTNRERVLIFSSRGVDSRSRHLMNDLKTLMPHSKGESKLEKTTALPMINEIAEMKNCSKVLYFEDRKHKDLYIWMSNVGEGPSVKFLVHNIHTMMELKLSGNCLKASRPVLSFDSTFDKKPHLTLIKNILMQIFGTPNHHPRSQPFIDHVLTFSVTPDDKIWFRNFQIVDDTLQLQEIGPRMVLELIRIFSGSFEGAVLFDNPNFASPNEKRRILKLQNAKKYEEKKQHDHAFLEKRVKVEEALNQLVPDPVGEIYNTEREVDDKEAVNILKKIDAPLKKRIAKNEAKRRTEQAKRRRH